ncbi:MAG TPA: hypothetical protein IAA20_11000 [Candidatus Enterococcus avicola]|uniref:Uncharacterized protein n=1 Tax=Candidatus Enterococcus avicola TaxID=2838561 RepID=A0A9D2F8H6_9ENTE|nr:hypothetical protein [Candidatus Enterococcus avicola]
MHYLDNKLLGKYFKSKNAQLRGIIPANGRYIEYVVIEGKPIEGSMLEIFSIDNGIAYVRVNDYLIEESEDFIVI